MAKRTWEETKNSIKSSDGKIVFRHPRVKNGSEWVDDMRLWPSVAYVDILNYLVLSAGIDGESLKNYKSTEAYQYLHSGKVGRVLLCENGEYVLLQAAVNPSQASTPSHNAWVLTRKNGRVETAGCTCIAGMGRSCSHAAAIMWKVENAVFNGLTGIACTDEQRKWNSGTQRNLAPKLLTEMSFVHHKASDAFIAPDVRPDYLPLPPTPRFETLAEMRSALGHLTLPKDSLLYKCIHAEAPAMTVQELPPAAHTDHDGSNGCPPCSGFYGTFVDIESDRLQLLTHEQNASHLWHDSRKLRITASTAKKVPVRTTPERFLQQHVYPRFHGNVATRHGVAGEVLALKWLEDRGHIVTRRGTVLCPTEPWLSASPDGVLSTGELLEIKCLFLKPHETVQDLMESKKYDVRIVEGAPKLLPNGPRGMYMQIQLALLCTNLRACKLLLWSHLQQVMLHVAFDKAFCTKTVARLKDFYFRHMLIRKFRRVLQVQSLKPHTPTLVAGWNTM
ncbi:hypothetical protein ACEWY4_010208 [Coilia grayii]|uniref:SWIM-type domain-containing protein n=1 Tax=Coilia grayii TaxID=363190 RepID=A0ABD1K8K4_9TELE